MNPARRVRQAYRVAHAQLRVAPPGKAHGSAPVTRHRCQHAPGQIVQPRRIRLKQRIIGNRQGKERRISLRDPVDALLLRPHGHEAQGIHRPIAFAVPLQLQIGLRVNPARFGRAVPQGAQREAAASIQTHKAARRRRDVPQRPAKGTALPFRRSVNHAVPVGHFAAPLEARLGEGVPPQRRQRRRVIESIRKGRGKRATHAVHRLEPQQGFALQISCALHLKYAQRPPERFARVHRAQLRHQRRTGKHPSAQQRAARVPLPGIVHQIQRAVGGEYAAGRKRAVRAFLHRQRGYQLPLQRNFLSAPKNNAPAHAQVADGRVHPLRPIHRRFTSPSSSFPHPPRPARRPPCAKRPCSGRRSCTPSPGARRSPGRDRPP